MVEKDLEAMAAQAIRDVLLLRRVEDVRGGRLDSRDCRDSMGPSSKQDVGRLCLVRVAAQSALVGLQDALQLNRLRDGVVLVLLFRHNQEVSGALEVERHIALLVHQREHVRGQRLWE